MHSFVFFFFLSLLPHASASFLFFLSFVLFLIFLLLVSFLLNIINFVAFLSKSPIDILSFFFLSRVNSSPLRSPTPPQSAPIIVTLHPFPTTLIHTEVTFSPLYILTRPDSQPPTPVSFSTSQSTRLSFTLTRILFHSYSHSLSHSHSHTHILSLSFTLIHFIPSILGQQLTSTQR
ncbi:hypothetical protein BKA57DRAFT_152095 [Linnemannia elongata]|nr:hypothetical protein BKA57DRAFT_152095 [Linnemannia elongata]